MKAEPTTKELIEMLYARHPDIFPKPKQERGWVGLTDEDAQWVYDNCRTLTDVMKMTESLLRRKNT